MPIADSSCQRWISLLEAGDDAAVERLWNVYFERLVQYDAMLKTLQDPDLVDFATMKLEGYTNAEIAERRNRSERTSERKLQLIHKL